jgi:hypothetical protein
MRLKHNLKNQIFGRLIVLKYMSYGQWKCRCDCGRETIVSGVHLRKGTTKSCGCLAKEKLNMTEDKIQHRKEQALATNKACLAGGKFGSLKVLGQMKNKKGLYYAWACRCDCGSIVVYRSTELLTGIKTHCGCQTYINEFDKAYKDKGGLIMFRKIVNSTSNYHEAAEYFGFTRERARQVASKYFNVKKYLVLKNKHNLNE